MSWVRGRVRVARDAAQGAVRRAGWPPAQALQHGDAPFRLEPFGQPRKSAACGVAPPCRSAATSRRRALHSTYFRGCPTPNPVQDTL